MKKNKFYILDVFAETRFSGNQLAVVMDANNLSEKEMHEIAKEMNFSETAFVLSPEKRQGGYDIRIFTPEREVPFAGHPSLGTAYILLREYEKKRTEHLILNMKIGQIPITIKYKENEPEYLFMKQIQPTFNWSLDAETIAQVLNVNSQEIDDQFPIEEVSTGLSFLIVPFRNLEAVKNIHLNLEKYFNLLEHTVAKAILVFCPETYRKGHDLNVRVFSDYYGIPEDSASGSGSGCLAAYLVNHKYFGSNKIEIKIEQGYEIGRQSLLFLKAEKSDKYDINVGGKVILTATGELEI